MEKKIKRINGKEGYIMLKQDNQLWKILIEETDTGIYICDYNTYEIIFMNKEVENYLKLEEDSYCGKKCYEIIAGLDKPCPFCKMSDMNKDIFLEREINHKGRYINMRGKLIELDEKTMHIEYVRDVTEKKNIDERLEQERKENTKFLDLVPSGVAIYDITQNGEVVKAYYNQSLCEMLGYTREELINIPHQEICKPISDDLNRVNEVLQQTKYDGKPIIVEYSTTRKNGEVIHLQVCVSMTMNENKIIRCSVLYVDVSQQQKMTQELSNAQKRLEAALKCSDIIVWEYDIKNKCIYQNHDYYKGKNEFEKTIYNVPESILESGIIHPNSVDDFKNLYEEIKKTKKIVTKDIMFFKDNKTKECCQRISYIPEFNSDGKCESFIGISIDITSQKELEEQYQNEIKYRESLNGKTIIATLCVNVTKNVIEDLSAKEDFSQYCNDVDSYDAAVKLVVSSNRIARIKHDETKKFLSKNILSEFKNGTSVITGLFQRKNNDCTKQWIRVTSKITKRPYSDDIIAFIYIMDCNKEIILKNTFNHVANNLYDLMMYIDVETQNFTVFVKGQSEAIDLKNYDLYINERVLKESKIYQEINVENISRKMSINVIKDQLKQHGEYSFVIASKNNKNEFEVKRMHYSYLDERKEVIILIRTDITDLYIQEQEQKENLQHALNCAEQANKAKSLFLSSMSHDIRTPMNAIVGMTTLAIDDMDNKDKLKEDLSVIISSSHHLLGLINDVLDMSKIESGAMIFANENYNVIDVFNGIEGIMRHIFKEKEQSFEMKINNIIAPEAVGDEQRLQRIIINLLANASKFTQNKGKIELTVEQKATKNEKFVLLIINVKDNGVGIAKEMQKQIFEPFVRNGMSGINQIEGTGLGLAIVKSIVNARGGSIIVDSEQGKGSTFTVEIPIQVAENNQILIENTSINENIVKADFKGINVLLIEDHPINMAIAKRMLEKCGVTVDTAENGALGYDKFMMDDKKYDMIFMDIQMPVMNGYEATMSIRQSKRKDAKIIPIVAMTANVFTDDIRKAKNSGMNAHIGKPINLEGIQEILYKYCRKEGFQ